MSGRTRNPVARLRWLLLPYIGYYCDGTEYWRWYMGPARRLWLALAWLPGGAMYREKP